MTDKKQKKPITVGFIALGCPKNIVDSEKMLADIAQADMVIAADIDNCDAVVINTCGFIEPAKKEAFDVIRTVLKKKTARSVGRVIVTGCLAQRMGKDLAEKLKGIDAVVGLNYRDNLPEIIKQTINRKAAPPLIHTSESANTISDDTTRLLITPPHSVYLRISEGCNKNCSFCTIPAIRGRFRSKPQDMILAEARQLVENGAVELSIIAQDSSYYAKDLGMSNGLGKLIKELEKIDRLHWLRLMYLYPASIDAKLIETIASSKKTLNYIDMPIQHINNDILKRMNRIDTEQKTIELIQSLRTAMPDVILRTTVITGFPGETDQQFEQLLDFIRWAKFDALGCFTFYPEKGTPAAKLPNQLSEKIKKQRLNSIMLTQQEIAFEKAKQRIGSELSILVDEYTDSSTAKGRFYGQAPEIDSICTIQNCTAPPGRFISAKVTAAENYDLIVRQI